MAIECLSTTTLHQSALIILEYNIILSILNELQNLNTIVNESKLDINLIDIELKQLNANLNKLKYFINNYSKCCKQADDKENHLVNLIIIELSNIKNKISEILVKIGIIYRFFI